MDGNMSATDGIFSSGSFSGNITSSATITGGTITGATITTSQNSSYGNTRVRMNSSNATLELLSDGNVYGQLYTFNSGNEVILRHGNTNTVYGFPTSAPVLSLSPTTISLGWTNSIGSAAGGFSLFYSEGSSFPYSSVFTGSVQSIGNGSIASPEFRNISAGSTAKSTSDSSGYIGDIYIQF
jgi:hypothetical protein